MSEPVDSQEAVFRFLAEPKTHGLAEAVVRVDTANAVVFLAGADAYKVKRAVRFPFMDLSTLDKRREACEVTTGEISPAPCGGDRRSGRIEAHRDYLLSLIRRSPDMTLLEIQERLIANCGERFCGLCAVAFLRPSRDHL